MSRGNLLFPTQVAVTETSIVHYTPEWVGGRDTGRRHGLTGAHADGRERRRR